MKLAFVGTSCTGKTTILRELKKQFKGDINIQFVDEAARILFMRHTKINRFSQSTQEKIQSLAMEMEKVAHTFSPKVIFCDRSAIDCIAYLKARGKYNEADRLFERVTHWLPTYNRLLLLDPVDVPYRQDRVRLESEDQRISFHMGFLNLFKERNIEYELLSGNIEERVYKVHEIINNHLPRQVKIKKYER